MRQIYTGVDLLQQTKRLGESLHGVGASSFKYISSRVKFVVHEHFIDQRSTVANVRVSATEIQGLEDDIEHIEGEPGEYRMEIEVFHQLHCLVSAHLPSFQNPLQAQLTHTSLHAQHKLRTQIYAPKTPWDAEMSFHMGKSRPFSLPFPVD